MSASTHTDQHRPERRAGRAVPGAPGVATTIAAAWVATLACAGAAAQDDGVDLEPPLIEHDVLAEAEAGAEQSFVAQVVDDRRLDSVRLYWRRAGEERFEASPMGRVAGSSTWIARVPTGPDETRSIEYWIEARDAGGNRTVRGFAFSPLVRRILAPPGAVASGEGSGAPARPSESRRGASGAAEPASGPVPERRTVLWLVLGGLGVALIAGLAASGGGGGGGTGGGCGDDGCELTITFDPPVAP